MHWPHLLAYFFGGVFLANAVPHLVSGLMGRAFQTPFATPRGVGRSSSTINVLWGFFNLVVGYLLLCQVGDFELRNVLDAGSAGAGALVLAVAMAEHFGRYNGGKA